MRRNVYWKKSIALLVSFLMTGCGLDSCLYTTECTSTNTDDLICSDLSATVIKRYSEESMNALEAENYSEAILFLNCLITNSPAEHKYYARRGLAYVGRTGKYSPTTLLLNLSDPNYLTTLQTELTSLQPVDINDVDTLYQIGEDLIRGSSDILTAISLSSGSTSYQTIKWLALLYSGMGAAYILNSHKLYDAPKQLNSSLIEKIDLSRAVQVKDHLASTYQISLDYMNDSDSVSAGLAVVSGAILLGMNYPQYLVNINLSGDLQGFIDFLQQ